MAGGKLRILWDRDEPATVVIYGAGGAVSTAFSVNGSPVSFPYHLTGDTTFATAKGDTYSLSVKMNGVEIASDLDSTKTIPLINGDAECVVAPSPRDGFVPTALAATRGTLYLKASGTGLSLETTAVATGDGAVLGFELDPDRESSGDWWEQTEDGFVLNQVADYKYGIAVKGSATYPDVPTLVYVDFYMEPDLSVNLGMASDGSDNSPAFTPGLVTPLAFFCKEGSVSSVAVAPHALPITLRGMVCDNDGDLVAGATLDVDVRISLTQVWAGTRYTEDDFA